MTAYSVCRGPSPEREGLRNRELEFQQLGDTLTVVVGISEGHL